MDDLTVLEAVYLTSVGIASYNLKNSVPNHIPLHNQFLKSDQLKTQNYLANFTLFGGKITYEYFEYFVITLFSWYKEYVLQILNRFYQF